MATFEELRGRLLHGVGLFASNLDTLLAAAEAQGFEKGHAEGVVEERERLEANDLGQEIPFPPALIVEPKETQ